MKKTAPKKFSGTVKKAPVVKKVTSAAILESIQQPKKVKMESASTPKTENSEIVVSPAVPVEKPTAAPSAPVQEPVIVASAPPPILAKPSVDVVEMSIPSEYTGLKDNMNVADTSPEIKSDHADVAKEIVKEQSKPVPDVATDAPLKIESEEEVRDVPPIERQNKRLFLLGVVVTLLVIVLTGVFAFYFLSQNGTKKPELPKQLEVTASPTPESIKRSGWTIEVLNGTATPGVAKKLADALSALGYTIVTTGNADRKDYTATEVFVADGKSKEEIRLFLADVNNELSGASISGQLSNSTASARIIIGKN